MRHLTESVVLLLLLMMTGCGNQNPVGAGATTAATVPTQNEVDEKHAANFLAAAKDFQQEGQPKHAVNTLRELIDQYPKSDAADEASELLAEIEEGEPDTGTSE